MQPLVSKAFPLQPRKLYAYAIAVIAMIVVFVATRSHQPSKTGSQEKNESRHLTKNTDQHRVTDSSSSLQRPPVSSRRESYHTRHFRVARVDYETLMDDHPGVKRVREEIRSQNRIIHECAKGGYGNQHPAIQSLRQQLLDKEKQLVTEVSKAQTQILTAVAQVARSGDWQLVVASTGAKVDEAKIEKRSELRNLAKTNLTKDVREALLW